MCFDYFYLIPYLHGFLSLFLSLSLYSFIAFSLFLSIYIIIFIFSLDYISIFLHQKSFLSLGLQGRGRPEQEPADITGSTLPLPFNLSPGTLQGDRREGEGMGRAWREWCCSYPKCGYITDRESWLRQHVRTHTGEKPFACPYCSFRSAQKGNVTVHVRRLHHRDGLNLFGSSDPSSSSSDTVSDPEFNLQWLVKDKFQGGSEFAKEQNGVCD